MTIAILGWGSLIWKPQNLRYHGSWKAGGPILPIEFSKIAENKRLSAVIDSQNGTMCRTQFVISSRTDLKDAIEDLRQREETTAEYIGYLDLETDRRSIKEYSEQIDVDQTVRQWCQSNQITAAVWTAILPNFPDKLGVPFSIEAALDYYQRLSAADQASVMEYFDKTPPEIDTPLRRQMQLQKVMR
jgi:hypothetical protein